MSKLIRSNALGIVALLLVSRIAWAGQGPDLSMAYTDGVTHIAPGGTLIYTLTVTNNSNFDATNATATATVPAVLSFTSSPNNGVFANGTVTFSNVTITANSSINLQFNAAVVLPLPSGTAHNYTSTATVATDPNQGADPNPNDNSASDINALDLAPDPVLCSATDGVACSYANGLLTYVLEPCNIGNIGITGVVVTDTIPIGTTFVSADNGGTFANGVVTWPTYSIAGGIHTFRSVTVKVNSPLPAGVLNLVNTANITDDGTNGVDANPNNNTIVDTDCIMPSTFLTITKTVDLINPNVGDSVMYSVVVTNAGPNAASNVTVTDAPPAGLTLIAVTQTAGNYDTTKGLWTIGTMANGATATLMLTATVNAGAPSTIVNTACVFNTPEVDSNSTNCASVTINPGCTTKPTIVSGPTITPSALVPGIPATFTITTSNNGSGVPVVATWDFGDGSTGTGGTVTHTYTAAGNYIVKVVVANACGGVGTSAQSSLAVAPGAAPFQCSLLRASFNLTRPNADSLTLVSQIALPAGFSAAGKKVLVQINNYTFSAILDGKGRFSDGVHSLAIKPFAAGGTLLSLKISHTSLRTQLLPGLTPNTHAQTFKGTPFLIEIGSQNYTATFDTFYTAKSVSGTLTK